MPAPTNLTVTTQITTAVREVDFVTRFSKNWKALSEILGIMRPIRKTPGTKLVSYKASVDGGLKGGATVTEGDEIPYTMTKVEPVSYSDITVEKYRKGVSIEAVAKYGAEIAVQKTDDAFLAELQNNVLGRFYTFLKTGSLTGSAATWQSALAMAMGAVINRFEGSDMTVTEVVGFANVLDLYEYLGEKDISVQSAFGLQYIKDFLGYKTLFLLPTKYIPRKTVIACPVENIDLYYIDPADSDFAQLGLNYRVEGETNLIGFHVQGDYSRAIGDVFALMGMTLWAEYLDGIAVYTVSATTTTTPGSSESP